MPLSVSILSKPRALARGVEGLIFPEILNLGMFMECGAKEPERLQTNPFRRLSGVAKISVQMRFCGALFPDNAKKAKALKLLYLFYRA